MVGNTIKDYEIILNSRDLVKIILNDRFYFGLEQRLNYKQLNRFLMTGKEINVQGTELILKMSLKALYYFKIHMPILGVKTILVLLGIYLKRMFFCRIYLLCY